MLDTARTFETPEGIELQQEIAGPVVRVLAYSVDLLFNGILFLLIIFVGQYLDKLGTGLILISVFILQWFYPVFFEVWSNGRTPGKKLFKIRVVHEDGTPVGWSASMVRNLLRVVDFLPFAYTLGLSSIIISRDFKRLGDLAAGTLVVYYKDLEKQPEIPARSPKNMPIPLTLKEQQAIISFAERSKLLSHDRSKELANILSPILGKSDDDAIEELYQVAVGYRGNR